MYLNVFHLFQKKKLVKESFYDFKKKINALFKIKDIRLKDFEMK